MPEVAHQVWPEVLEPDAWAPFGWLPVPDTDPEDGQHRLAFEWSDPHVNVIGHTRAEIAETPDGLRCDVLYRHRTHTQVLMPLDHPCVLAVAAPGGELDGPAAAAAVTAFALAPLQAVVLHRGTWHWGPFPFAHDAVRLFNVQGLGYLRDNESVDLAARGASVLVRTDRLGGR